MPSIDTECPQNPESIFIHLHNRFLNIAIMISFYPISVLIVNGIITIGDLYISAKGGVRTKGVYRLYCIYYFLYGSRGMVFACLGIFVDPCFRRVSLLSLVKSVSLSQGLRAAWAGPSGDLVPVRTVFKFMLTAGGPRSRCRGKLAGDPGCTHSHVAI